MWSVCDFVFSMCIMCHSFFKKLLLSSVSREDTQLPNYLITRASKNSPSLIQANTTSFAVASYEEVVSFLAPPLVAPARALLVRAVVSIKCPACSQECSLAQGSPLFWVATFLATILVGKASE